MQSSKWLHCNAGANDREASENHNYESKNYESHDYERKNSYQLMT